MPAPRQRQGCCALVAGMSCVARPSGFVALLLVVAAGMPLRAQQAPQRVTSDTPQYCMVLLDRVSELVRDMETPPPQEVTSLSTEGQRMCDKGQTRGGITRLRRALVLLRGQALEAGP